MCDSGAQYLGATTDVTRTIFIGGRKPKKEYILNYTRVLKGHIAVALTNLKKYSNGKQIDILARKNLKKVGLDYGHGTGHGVGAFLNVHEGPQRISPVSHDVALKPGMIISNEPGYYETGWGGIRLENLCRVKSLESGLHCTIILEAKPGWDWKH